MYREAALADLVRRSLTAQVSTVVTAEYRSRFASWQERASVRVKPRRILDSGDRERVYFPPELVPLLTHPLVARLEPEARQRILVHRLYGYLHFTTELEELGVIPVATKISRGRSGLPLPEAMREDAFRIVTDEAWHAQFSYDLMRQVQAETAVPCRLPRLPQFADRLDRIRRRLDPELRGTEALVFAIVSETLISAILADLPHDGRLPVAVRELVADHAEDEGRHHAYFRSLLAYFWPALGRDRCERLGPWLPEVILAFLEPDLGTLGHALTDAGLSAAEVEQVLIESYPPDAVAAEAASAARVTIRYFAELGILDDPGSFDAFAAAGLLGYCRP